MNVIEQLKSIKGQLKYVKNVLAMGGLEKWEIKEYESLIKDYNAEIKRLKICIKVLNNQHILFGF